MGSMARHGGWPTTKKMKKKKKKGWMSAVRVAQVAKADKVAKLAVKLAAKLVVKPDLLKAAKVEQEDLLPMTLAKEDSALSLLMVVQRLFLPLLTSSSRATLLSE